MLTSAQAMSDLDIANAYRPLPIQEIAKRLGLSPDELHPYGRHKGKISLWHSTASNTSLEADISS